MTKEITAKMILAALLRTKQELDKHCEGLENPYMDTARYTIILLINNIAREANKK